MDESSRLIAIDASSAILDVARQKAADLAGRRIFFRTERALPRLPFAADVYDLVVSNLGLAESPSPSKTLRDFTRVAKPGGRVVATLPLAGTWQEFTDLYREVLVKHDKLPILARLDQWLAALPDVATVEELARRRRPRRRARRRRGVHAALQERARVLLRARRRVRPAPRLEGDRRHRPGAAGRVLVHQGGDRRLLRRSRLRGDHPRRLSLGQEGRAAAAILAAAEEPESLTTGEVSWSRPTTPTCRRATSRPSRRSSRRKRPRSSTPFAGRETTAPRSEFQGRPPSAGPV